MGDIEQKRNYIRRRQGERKSALLYFMEARPGIYKITNLINGKVYIGQSKNVRRRRSQHLDKLRAGKSHNRHLQHAFELYGEDNLEFSVLEYCLPEELNEKEVHYIELYDATTRGYNLTAGGTNAATPVPLQVRRENICKAQIVNKRKVVLCNTGQIFQSISEAAQTMNIAGSTITNCCCHHRYSAGKDVDGQPMVWMYYDEWVDMGASDIKASLHAAHVAAVGTRRAVICLNTLVVYNSIRDASSATGVDRKSMVACCHGNQRSAGKDINTGAGLRWMYYDDYVKLSDEEQNARRTAALAKWHNYRARAVRCLNSGVVFPSVTEAGQYAGVNWSAISACCAGKQSSAGVDPASHEALRWQYL